jgi:hypothetical protein
MEMFSDVGSLFQTHPSFLSVLGIAPWVTFLATSQHWKINVAPDAMLDWAVGATQEEDAFAISVS